MSVSCSSSFHPSFRPGRLLREAKRAQNLADDILRAKLHVSKDLEVTALALEILDPQLPEALRAHWDPKAHAEAQYISSGASVEKSFSRIDFPILIPADRLPPPLRSTTMASAA